MDSSLSVVAGEAVVVREYRIRMNLILTSAFRLLPSETPNQRAAIKGDIQIFLGFIYLAI